MKKQMKRVLVACQRSRMTRLFHASGLYNGGLVPSFPQVSSSTSLFPSRLISKSNHLKARKSKVALTKSIASHV